MSLMQDGLAWLADRLKESAGQSATYTRGEDTASVTVWLATPRPEQDGIDGVILERYDLMDVRMLAADLVIDGSETLPQRGDRISIARSTGTDVYEVMAHGNEPPYWWPDTDHVQVGVHCKQVTRG